MKQSQTGKNLLLIIACVALLFANVVHDLPKGDLGQEILLELRLPRLLLAILAGAALGLAGLWLQTLFRHALVEPGLLGVSAGSSLAAVIALMFWQHMIWVLPVAAVVGALLTLTLVLLLARRFQLQAEALLLVGVALSALAAAIAQLLLILSPDQTLRAASFWFMGSFAYAQWQSLLAGWLVFLSLALWGLKQAGSFDVWLLGEREAGYLGLPVKRFRRQVIWASAILVGVVVAQAGSVAFIGLMAPHIASRLFGCHHRAMIPGVIVVGALLTLFADTLSMRLLAPMELPVGIMTALFGAPFFLYVLYQRWRQ